MVVSRPRPSCPQPGAAVPVPRRRLRRPGRQLQLRRCSVSPAARDRHIPAGRRPDHGLGIDRQAHARDIRLRRPRHQERSGDLRRRRRPQHGNVAATCEGRRYRIRLHQSAQVRCARLSRRPMGPDPAEHRYRVDAGDGAHASQRGAPRCVIRRALLHRLRSVPPLSSGTRRQCSEGCAVGRGHHRRSRRHRSASLRGARPHPGA